MRSIASSVVRPIETSTFVDLEQNYKENVEYYLPHLHGIVSVQRVH